MNHCSACSSASSAESRRGGGRRMGAERAGSDRGMRSVLRLTDASRRPSHFRLNPRATTTSWTGPSARTPGGFCPFLRGNDKPDFFRGHSATRLFTSTTQEGGSDFQSIIGGFGLQHQVLRWDGFVGVLRMNMESLRIHPSARSHTRLPKLAPGGVAQTTTAPKEGGRQEARRRHSSRGSRTAADSQ